IAETQQLKKKIDDSVKSIEKLLRDHSEKIINSFNSEIDKIIKEITFEKPSRYIEIAAYDLVNQGNDLTPIKDIDPNKGQAEWYSMIGERKEKMEALKIQRQELEISLQPLERSYRIYQSQYLSTVKTINSFLLPQLKECVLALESADRLLDAAKDSKVSVEITPDESSLKLKFKETISGIDNLQIIINKFKDLEDINNLLVAFQTIYRKILSKWDNFHYKNKAPFVDFLNTIDVFTTRIAGTVNETVALVQKLNNITNNLIKLQNQINSKRNFLTSINEQIKNLEEEIQKAYSEIYDAIVYVKSRLVTVQLKDVQQKVSRMKLPAQLQLMNLQARKVFGIVADLANTLPDGSKKQKTLRSIISKIDWPGTAKDMFTNYELFVQNYEPFVKDLQLYLSDVEIQGSNLCP
ncbi:MAG: ABC transporter permease, partial [Fervidobacterium sp.]